MGAKTGHLVATDEAIVKRPFGVSINPQRPVLLTKKQDLTDLTYFLTDVTLGIGLTYCA